MHEVIIPKPHQYKEIAQIYNLAIQPFLEVYSEEEKKIFPLQENEQSIAEQCKEKDCFAVRIADKIVGYVIFRIKNQYCIWLSSLYAHPEFQNQGVGSLLLGEVEKIAKEKHVKIIALETHGKAKWALDFYACKGYCLIADKLDIFPYSIVLEKQPVVNRSLLGKLI